MQAAVAGDVAELLNAPEQEDGDEDVEAVIVSDDDDDEDIGEVGNQPVDDAPDEEEAPVQLGQQPGAVQAGPVGWRRRAREEGDGSRKDISAKTKLQLVTFYAEEPDEEKRLEARKAASDKAGCQLIRNSQVETWSKNRVQLEAEAARWGGGRVLRLTGGKNGLSQLAWLDALLWARIKGLFEQRSGFTKRTVKTACREFLQLNPTMDPPKNLHQWLRDWARRHHVTYKKPARSGDFSSETLKKDFQEFHAQLADVWTRQQFALECVANSDEMPLAPAGGMQKDSKYAVLAGEEATHAVKDFTFDTYKIGSFIPIVVLSGAFIPPLIIFRGGARDPEGEAAHYDPRCKVTFTESGNVDSRWMIEVYIPHLNAHWKSNGRPRLLILDHARAHYTAPVMAAFHAAGITLVMIPKGRTCFLQLCDTHLFATLRNYHKDQADTFAMKQKEGKWKVNMAWKRTLTQRFVTRSYALWLEKFSTKVAQWATSLGYITPTSDTVHIRKFDEYRFDHTKPPATKVVIALPPMGPPPPVQVDAPPAPPVASPAKKLPGRPPTPVTPHKGPTLLDLFSRRSQSQVAQSQVPPTPPAIPPPHPQEASADREYTPILGADELTQMSDRF